MEELALVAAEATVPAESTLADEEEHSGELEVGAYSVVAQAAVVARRVQEVAKGVLEEVAAVVQVVADLLGCARVVQPELQNGAAIADTVVEPAQQGLERERA